jgi:hypothetical protein
VEKKVMTKGRRSKSKEREKKVLTYKVHFRSLKIGHLQCMWVLGNEQERIAVTYFVFDTLSGLIHFSGRMVSPTDQKSKAVLSFKPMDAMY